MANATGRSRRDSVRDDEAFDVPAAVLCAFCGQPDCAGCTAASDDESGVVAIVPWERPGAGAWSRLWATSRAATVGADSFFAALPDGAISPAMRFAVLAEALAVLSMAALLVPLAAVALPGLALAIAQDAGTRADALRWFALGLPALTAWMVLAHAAHGAALDAGARRQGAKPQRRRALRFGLYACGWDLMSGPLGVVVTALSSGRKGLAELLALAMHAPGRSSAALLQGVYALRPEAVLRARRTGGRAAVALTILSGLAVVVIAVLAS